MANESSIEEFLECFARTGVKAPVFAEPHLDLAHAAPAAPAQRRRNSRRGRLGGALNDRRWSMARGRIPHGGSPWTELQECDEVTTSGWAVKGGVLPLESVINLRLREQTAEILKTLTAKEPVGSMEVRRRSRCGLLKQ
jgi:hypothetical protein